MKKVFVLIQVALLSIPCLTDTQSEKLHFKNLGYSIAPLEDVPNSDIYQTLMMFLPATDEFSPNVNIQIQPYNEPIDQYMKLSFSEFGDIGFALVRDSILNENTGIFEYTGTMEEESFHWYGKAISANEKIYLVTATALESQWKDVSEKLISCVNSFELD